MNFWNIMCIIYYDIREFNSPLKYFKNINNVSKI